MELVWSFLAFMAVVTLTPGGATALATASGMTHGIRRSIPLLIGMASGMAAMAVSCALGLGSLLSAFPQMQLALAVSGTIYFTWLAWKIARSGAPGAANGAGDQPLAFGNGLLLIWLNPKAWSLSLGVVAAFSGLAETPGRLAAILAPAFLGFGMLSLFLWCAGGAVLVRLLSTSRQWRMLNIALAALLLLSILPIWFA
ncbi:MAG: LysE family translocator [Thermaurantiacus sp.]